jgi:hypothetical protein
MFGKYNNNARDIHGKKPMINNHWQKRKLIMALCFFCVLFSPTPKAVAAKLFIPPVNAQSGEEVIVPVKIDNIDNLAGVKLIILYDQTILTYEKAIQTQTTASLMHVVNDKTPGRLIIVMAGAKGIQARDAAIVNLHFKTKAGLTKPESIRLTIPEMQLMNDNLQNLNYNIEINPVSVYPKKK